MLSLEKEVMTCWSLILSLAGWKKHWPCSCRGLPWSIWTSRIYRKIMATVSTRLMVTQVQAMRIRSNPSLRWWGPRIRSLWWGEIHKIDREWHLRDQETINFSSWVPNHRWNRKIWRSYRSHTCKEAIKSRESTKQTVMKRRPVHQTWMTPRWSLARLSRPESLIRMPLSLWVTRQKLWPKLKRR